MTIDDRARALQLALASQDEALTSQSWNEAHQTLCEALREERRAAFERAAQIARERSAHLPHYNDFERGYAEGRGAAYRAILSEAEKEQTAP